MDNDFEPDLGADVKQGVPADTVPAGAAQADSYAQQQREAQQVSAARFGLKNFMCNSTSPQPLLLMAPVQPVSVGGEVFPGIDTG